MSIFIVILILIVMFCLIAGFFTVVSLGIGFLTHLCISSIGLGHAFIAASIISAAAFFFLLYLLIESVRRANEDRGDGEIPDEPSILVMPHDFMKRLPGKSRPGRNQK